MNTPKTGEWPMANGPLEIGNRESEIDTAPVLKSNRPFASVIERAMSTSGARHEARGTRSEPSPRPSRLVPRASPTDPRMGVKRAQGAGEQGKKDAEAQGSASRPAEQNGSGGAEEKAPCTLSALHPCSSDKPEGAEVEAPLEDDATLDGSGAADDLPTNIVPFPAASVIIPFPLEEARAMKGNRGIGEPGSEGESTFALPLPCSSDSSRPCTLSPSLLCSDGVDIAELGLKQVDQSELPENVHQVEFATSLAGEESSEARDAGREAQGEDYSVDAEVAARGPEGGVSRLVPRAESGESEIENRLSNLPGDPGAAEESARGEVQGVGRGTRGEAYIVDAKVAASGPENGLSRLAPRASRLSVGTTGISAARQERRMKSWSNSEAAARPAQDALASGGVSEALRQRDVESTDSDASLDFSARNPGAAEWPAGRSVGRSDRPALELPTGRAVDAAGKVERISKLVLGEVALVRQHSSDSMAVVLRPDAETELFMHLSQRNGQVEVTVRCERGDVQLLGSLWGQLQESLAQQRVRLAPLQEGSSNHSNFNQSAGSDVNGGGHGSPRQSPEKQSMDEWPAPASSSHISAGRSATGRALERGGGGSRHRRLTTSRPGWETWA